MRPSVPLTVKDESPKDAVPLVNSVSVELKGGVPLAGEKEEVTPAGRLETLRAMFGRLMVDEPGVRLRLTAYVTVPPLRTVTVKGVEEMAKS